MVYDMIRFQLGREGWGLEGGGEGDKPAHDGAGVGIVRDTHTVLNSDVWIVRVSGGNGDKDNNDDNDGDLFVFQIFCCFHPHRILDRSR